MKGRAPSRCPAGRHGVSLVELLIALAISAMLLTATAMAINASFRAYADAAEQASSQAATRMVVNRLLTLIRTSTAHGPLSAQPASTLQITDPDDGITPYTVTIPAATLAGNTTTSPYIELIDTNGTDVKIVYLQYTNKAGVAKQELWMVTNPGNAATQKAQPLIGGVTSATFSCLRRKDSINLYVLDRGTMDLTVAPGADATLTMEHGHPTPIRVIASTMPRKLD
jgi:prepilin-type N-terminal cleavage/methylation domain-containing protein